MHLQILGDGEKSYFWLKLAWGKEVADTSSRSIVKWEPSPWPDFLQAGLLSFLLS